MSSEEKGGPRGRKQIEESVAGLEKRLRDLEHDRRRTTDRLEHLRSELHGHDSVSGSADAPRTAAGKIALFRMLFRGREDVYAKFWESRKTGRKGYGPACANEWVAGVCEKPAVKCGDCPNRAPLPITDRVIRDHLQGRHVVGVYPLLPDETCGFLAVDFDKAGWREDVAAFVATCRDQGLPVAVERSRSGDGAHAWFFFASPVPAHEARRMGCFLLTETMERRHQLGLDSYDRLFPNQDTMPAGGFGNLIALPLQHGARRQGNTVFLDDDFRPHPDQWAHLASIPRIDPEAVGRISSEAQRQGRVVGVRFVPPLDESDREPWNRPPSRRPPRRPIDEPVPAEVHAVLAQRLFVTKQGLPSALLNRIRRIAAFQNPEFYKRQALRLSTALTPRVICCAEEEAEHVALPRGCQSELEDLLAEHGIRLVVEERRTAGATHPLRFRGRLTAEQQRAADELLRHDIGLLVAPPGMGKTVIGIYLISRRARSALVLVHRRQLLDQWRSRLAMFLECDPADIGQIGGGKRKPTGRIDVAMIQSLARKGEVKDLVADYGHVIVDECHHAPAASFERVLAEARARYVTGLTATPRRRDGHDPIAEMQLGPVRYAADPLSPSVAPPFELRLVLRQTGFRCETADERPTIQAVYRALMEDRERNRLLLGDIRTAIEQGRNPIVLTERIAHLKLLERELKGHATNLVVMRGRTTARQRREAAETLARAPDTESRLILATGRFAGEGFDDDRLDTLFLAMPISWRGTLIQYAGRLHRPHPAKREVRIFDYVDRHVPMLDRMFRKRLAGYRSIGYDVAEGLFDGAASTDRPAEPG
jgi:superfamily II DNA or RNA helicase